MTSGTEIFEGTMRIFQTWSNLLLTFLKSLLSSRGVSLSDNHLCHTDPAQRTPGHSSLRKGALHPRRARQPSAVSAVQRSQQRELHRGSRNQHVTAVAWGLENEAVLSA